MSGHRLPVSRIWSDPSWQTVLERGNQFVTEIELDLVQVGNDFSPNIGINELFRKLKVLSKNIKIPITSYEADERDGASGNVINFRQHELWRWDDRSVSLFLDKL